MSPGELQRLRLAMQICSQLFGVVYVMDEPSAGLHSCDAQALLGALDPPNAAGNTVIVVVHAMRVAASSDWCWIWGRARVVRAATVLCPLRWRV
ncbi:hypothetical protein BER93_14355 [Xanthomonas fragariae]|nr:hypothetical protein BER92_14320 [Xanthomonas fragariae]AOD19082.1 hypothetical protein BER93_14355 [Xanthomonas fragariae]ENZ95900.1 excinuclease ABC subunit A [Xanthomonas fragariae LMG 25863]